MDPNLLSKCQCVTNTTAVVASNWNNMASVSGADDSAAREAVRVETSSVVLYGDGGSKEVLQGAIHTIILNRPKARNAVDGPTAKV